MNRYKQQSWNMQLILKLAMPVLLLLVVITGCKKDGRNYERVSHGPFSLTITETGELHAVEMKSFVMPRFGRYWYRLKIVGLLDHGTVVNKGDSVIQLDHTEIRKFIVERQTQLENQEASLTKLMVQHEIDKRNLMAAYNSQLATFELNRIELESAAFSSENEQRIKQLQFDLAKNSLAKIESKLKLIDVQNLYQLKIQEIRVAQLKSQVENGIETLPELTIRTPISGIFQISENRRTRDVMRIGDEIYYGTHMGSVPDLTWMKVKTTVNETDIQKVSEGMKVKVKLDALEGVYFDGTVTYIGKLCRKDSRDARKKVFDVTVTMNESDERLKPGMTVSCEYICADFPDVLQVPNSTVLNENGSSYVYLLKQNKAVKTPVETGLKNARFTVLKTELKKGSKLVPFKELNSIEIQK